MRIVRFERHGAPEEVLDCVEAPEPRAPGPGEVALDMVAMTINPADLLTVEGRYGVVPPPLPFTPGAEGAARVARVGEGVTTVKPGDLVVPLAGNCWVERMTVKAAALIPMPAGTDPFQAAMLKANPATAEVMLSDLADLAPGDWVLQNAANSAVGRFVVLLAKRRGLRTLNVVRRLEAGRAVSQAGGDVILVSGGEQPERLAAEVRRATGGALPKLALDAVGGLATNVLAAALAEGGRVVNYGLLSGQPCQVDPKHLVFRDVTLSGFWLATWFKGASRERVQALYGGLSPLIADGTLSAPIAATYPLSRIREAAAHAGRGARDGKIILVPDPA